MRRLVVLITSICLSIPGIISISPANASASSTTGLLSAGYSHTCAVVDGGVKCWGSNASGQLGDGTFTNSTTPVSAIPAGSGVTAVSAGFNSTCAVVYSRVKCWGANSYGQLGDGTLTSRTTPVPATTAGNGVTSVSIGISSTCVVVNGGVKCWGDNTYGQLGDGTPNSNINGVYPVTPYSGATAVAVGYYSAGYSSACAIVSGGVKCWGYNLDGQLGNGTTTTSRTPVNTILPGSGVTSIDIARKNACAVVSGAVKCWGDNSFGQLGDGTYTSSRSANAVTPIGSGATAVSVGFFSSCAVVSGGVKCWGDNSSAQLGDQTFTISRTPVSAIPANSGVTSIDAGRSHNCAMAQGGVKCWGDNQFGQTDSRGQGPGSVSRWPVSVTPPTTPTRPGYELVGWSATDGGIAVSFPYTHFDALQSGITLYPLWASTSYSVFFDSLGGTDVRESSFVLGESFNAPESPTRDGYAFAGWALADGAPLTFPYTPSYGYDLVVYALWAPNTYTASFDAGVGSDSIQVSFVTGENVEAPITPTQRGYTFAGWSFIVDGAAVGFPYSPSGLGNLSFYARWIPNTYAVTYHYNDATTDNKVQSATYTTATQVITLPKPSKHGFTFGGWYEDESFTQKAGDAGMGYAPSGTTPTINLYAKWVMNRFSRLVSPVVRGKSSVGSVLTTAVTPFGAGAAYTYQWLRNGVAIQGASDRKYLLTPADLGSYVSFRVCGSKLLFETACLDSSSSVVGLGDLGRKPVVALKFSSVKVGAFVTGNPGVWGSGVVLSYQWLRDGVDIPGETSLTHQVNADDRGHNLSFKVLAQKTGYTDIVKFSVAKLIP